MADERIGLQLDLTQAVESAKQLSAALQSTKVDTTALSAALESLSDDEIKLADESTRFSDALDALIADEARAAEAAKLLADVGLARLAEQEAKAAAKAQELAAENARLAASARDLLGDFNATAVAADHVGDTYEILAVSGHGYELVERNIATAQANSAASFRKLGESVDKLTPAQEKAARASAEMQRGFLSLTNAAQDFQAAGLNGILNNIPQIVTQFGGSSGLAAAIGGAAVAYYAAIPAIKAFWGAVVDGSNDVPKAVDKLAQMNAELKTNGDRLKELADQGSLTNAQLAEYNGLLAENVELERKANAEKERRNGLDAIRKKEAEGNAESASIVKAAIDEAGGVDNVNNATRNKMLAESPEVRDATANANRTAKDNAAAASNPLNPLAQLKALVAIRKAERERDEATKRVENQSSDLILAASKGDEAAVRELARIHGGSFAQATPEAIRAQNAEVDAGEAQGQRLAKNNAKRKAAGAQVDALNQAGREGERAMQGQVKANADDDLKKSLKSLELPNIPETPEFTARRQAQAAGRQIAALEQQANGVVQEMQMGQMMGLDTGPLQQTLSQIQMMWQQQQQQLQAAQYKLNQVGFDRPVGWQAGRR